ncbi:unnamed protein product [Dracunculus medinensis]|uniref:Transmembrane protein 144 n=1 Tax=Dracunculus medinensis TaxID=318479 RepID=A0A0N4U1R9_DRAME|nr:unnamed protein product [Dracunculus medinensis]
MTLDVIEGLVACAISSTFFGSMFVPLKKFDVGDGIFAQWVTGTAIFMFGMIVSAARGFPAFQPFAMLGGIFWAIGNATAIPIISMIGLGMGVLLWGVTNCVCGWASSRYGLFGLKKEVPNNVLLNYIGLGLVILGGIFFSRVKSTSRLAPSSNSAIHIETTDQEEASEFDQLRRDPPLNKRVRGIVLSLFAGVFYGTTFVPVIYIQQHDDKASQNGLDYVFSHFCGILITTTSIFLIYCVFKRNRPFINNQIVLPACLTGTLWSVAQLAWFFANDRISQSISFPINSMVPGVCAALWSVFYFREIQGARNMQILFSAIGITLTGAILVGLSKAI